ncbi:MAG: tRNA dihydrouridine synthase DusB [Clostridiales bacterium]|jgi:tRNA-dihydrouridine synthase B|nr:tRNA dihydrouridine synthase DusB [Clostridiales bacterium]
MRLGNIDLKNNLMLAPLAGYTDAGFRAAAILCGAGLTYSEMVSAKGLVYAGEKTKTLLRTSEYENPRAVQLFGREPEIFYKAASLYLEKFDIIDVNMGCPVPKIVKNGEGSALLKDIPRMKEIMAALKEAAGNRAVTAKIRAGFDKVNAPETAAALEDAGADAVAVHARLQTQYYSGKADYSIIKEVKNALKIPVIGNGDVASAEDYFRIRETGCDFVMIGRGAVGNPYIFADILEAEGKERKKDRDIKACILLQISVLEEYCGEKLLVNHMKKHIAAYAKGMKNAKILKDSVMKAERIEELKKIIGEYF